MHCINYAKREREKPLLFKLTLRSLFTLSQAQSISCQELLVVFGLSGLNSNRTNHKPRKKLANKKCQHISEWLWGIRTRNCALILWRSIQKVYSVCDTGNLMKDEKLCQDILYLHNSSLKQRNCFPKLYVKFMFSSHRLVAITPKKGAKCAWKIVISSFVADSPS